MHKIRAQHQLSMQTLPSVLHRSGLFLGRLKLGCNSFFLCPRLSGFYSRGVFLNRETEMKDVRCPIGSVSGETIF